MTTKTNRNATTENANRKVFENAEIVGFDPKPLIHHDLMFVYFRLPNGKKLHAVAPAYCDNVRQFMANKATSTPAPHVTITTSVDTVEIDGKSHWVMYSPLEPSEEGRAKYEAWKVRYLATAEAESAPLSDAEKSIREMVFGKPAKAPKKSSKKATVAISDLL